MATKKGIVVSPPFELIGERGVRIGGRPSPFDLRKYLLYWDEIDYADNNIISVAPSDDIQFLLDCGIAARTRVIFQGPHNGNPTFFFRTQEAVFEKHEKENPGCWSIAQLSPAPYFTNPQEMVGVEIELWNMLPVPQADVPLPDILEFKERRQDELIALRCHLDDVYQQIISAKDIPRKMNSQIANLELDLKNLDKTLGEAGIGHILTSLRSYIGSELPTALGVGGFGAASLSSMLACSPLAAGLVGAGVWLAVKPIIVPRLKGVNTPFTYLNSIRKVLGR